MVLKLSDYPKQGNLKNCHDQEPKDTWQMNLMCYPGWDLRREKGYEVNKSERIWTLVNLKSKNKQNKRIFKKSIKYLGLFKNFSHTRCYYLPVLKILPMMTGDTAGELHTISDFTIIHSLGHLPI